MTTKKFSSEAELAAVTVEWLQAQEWEVYQEVDYGHVCDIVAVRGPIIWAIECKMTLSLGLISQAHRWIPYANRVSICVPSPRNTRSHFTTTVMTDYGIGCLDVFVETFYCRERVKESLAPRLNRHISNRLRESLRDEQKTWAKAGNPDGKRYTPYQNTKMQVQSYVKRMGSITFAELISSINHHYASDSSAKCSLKHWIEKGVIAGVKMRREGKRLFVEACED